MSSKNKALSKYLVTTAFPPESPDTSKSLTTLPSSSEPSFIEKFGQRLASQLIGCNTFICKVFGQDSSNTDQTCVSSRKRPISQERNNVKDGNGRRQEGNGWCGFAKSFRLYWRTPLITNSFGNDLFSTCSDLYSPSDEGNIIINTGDALFVDVTFDFVVPSHVKLLSKDNAAAKKSTDAKREDIVPRLDISFGALIKLPSDSSDSRNPSPRNNEQTFKVSANGKSQMSQNNGAIYVQSANLSKSMLETYAQEVDIDLEDTGPVGMADLIANSLLENEINFSDSEHTSTSTTRSHIFLDDGKLNVQIGLYHRDIMEEGTLFRASQRVYPSRMLKTHQTHRDSICCIDQYIGPTVLPMFLSNLSRNNLNLNKRKNGDNAKQQMEKEAREAFESWRKYWFNVIQNENLDETKLCNGYGVVQSHNNFDKCNTSMATSKSKAHGVAVAAKVQKQKSHFFQENSHSKGNFPLTKPMTILHNERPLHGHVKVNIGMHCKKKKKGKVQIGKM